MKLFMIEYYGYVDGDNARQVKFVAAEEMPTDEEAADILAAGEDTDFTDEVINVEELDTVWSKGGGDMYSVKLERIL